MFFVMKRMAVVVGILVMAFTMASCGLSSSNGMGSYKPHPPPPPPGPGGVVAPVSAR
jgi:predicted small secreted protein